MTEFSFSSKVLSGKAHQVIKSYLYNIVYPMVKTLLREIFH